MREILFRGQTRRYGEKVKLNGEKIKSNWVYGGIFPQNGEGDFAIIYQQKPTIKKYPVYADTVGQYIGFTDKNCAKIFEGDILALNDMDGSKGIYEVFYDGNNGKFAIAANGNRNYVDDFELFERNEYFKLFTVIGNIYDSPELLEVKLSKWVKKKDRKVGEAEAYCLTCGREVVYQVINNRYQFENYCPHCGARMDLESDKEIIGGEEYNAMIQKEVVHKKRIEERKKERNLRNE